jgi:hypothetical protein
MRFVVLSLCIAVSSALAQAPGASEPACNVVVGVLDVNERGELARPEPTPEQCAAAEAIVEKFLSADRRDFGRIVSREAIPGNVYTSIRRYGVFGGPWGPVGLPRSDLPGLKHAVSWLKDNLVVVVTEGSDFAGPTVRVVVADLETLEVCSYPNWPVTADPRSLSVSELQAILESGLRGDRETPACHLEPLVID